MNLMNHILYMNNILGFPIFKAERSTYLARVSRIGLWMLLQHIQIISVLLKKLLVLSTLRVYTLPVSLSYLDLSQKNEKNI